MILRESRETPPEMVKATLRTRLGSLRGCRGRLAGATCIHLQDNCGRHLLHSNISGVQSLRSKRQGSQGLRGSLPSAVLKLPESVRPHAKTVVHMDTTRMQQAGQRCAVLDPVLLHRSPETGSPHSPDFGLF